MPKCCIGSKVLKRNPNGPHHGFDCVNIDAEILFDIKLTDGKMKMKIDKAEAEMKFYAGVFPACEGLEPKWLYDMHDQFKVDVTYEDKYVLMLNDSTKVILMKMYFCKICSLFGFYRFQLVPTIKLRDLSPKK